MNNNLINNSKTDKLLLLINKILLSIIVLIVTIPPLLYVLIGSFLQPDVLLTKGLSFDSKHWTIDGYVRIFNDGSIMRGFLNSILYATGFTLVSVGFTVLAGYSLSVDSLVGKRIIMIYFLVTMFFNGGMVPTYLLVKELGLLNSPWAIILPGGYYRLEYYLGKNLF